MNDKRIFWATNEVKIVNDPKEEEYKQKQIIADEWAKKINELLRNNQERID